MTQAARTNPVHVEFDQILTYVEPANVRIGFLEQLVDPFAMGQAARIKAGLLEALRSLEKSQDKIWLALPAVRQVTEEIGEAYKRLQRLEDKLSSLRKEEVGHGDEDVLQRLPSSGKANETLTGDTQCETQWYSDEENDRDAENEYGNDDENFLMSGALPTTQSSAGQVQNKSRHRRAIPYPLNLRRSRAEVMASLLEEEFAGLEIPLRDADRERQGSTSGWLCAQEIMCGIEDLRSIRPKLAFFKIFEIRALKTWLKEQKYLRRSSGISRTEKLLQLLFALQDGARFEVLAVLFSRSPRQVER